MIKPYTQTLDSVLEVTLMVGDFILALSIYPLRLAIGWWRKRFGSRDVPDCDDDSSESSLSDSQSLEATQHDWRTSSDTRPSSLRHNSSHMSSASQHEIWHPPAASYSDEDLAGGDRTIRPPASRNGSAGHVDEWRQYEGMPSAYPPTPFAMNFSHLPTAPPSQSPNEQPEGLPQQDFHQSLLPPREPLNPSRAGDLSDKQHAFGISPLSPLSGASDVDVSMYTDDDEEEDDFNITLQTPLRPHQLLSPPPRPHPRLFVAPPSISASSGILSRSSALTTADNASPMRSDMFSDSSQSTPNESVAPSPIIGQKRSYPRNKPLNSRNRVRPVEESGDSMDESSDAVNTSLSATEKRTRLPATTQSDLNSLQRLASASSTDTADDKTDSTSGVGDVPTSEQEPGEVVPPEEKRRKVARSQPPSRVVNASRPLKSRIVKPRSPPASPRSKTRIQSRTGPSQTHPFQPAQAKRAPLKTRTEPLVTKKVGRLQTSHSGSQESTAESSSVGEGPVNLPPKPGGSRGVAKRKV